MDLKDDIVQGF